MVGDSVLLKAEERLTNTLRWDPGYIVTRVNGTTHWLRHEDSGRTRKVHREKLRLADVTLDWDRIPPRPKRQHNSKGASTNVRVE